LVRLPKLVPAFSSKGFFTDVDPKTGKRVSEVANALDAHGPTLTTLLVSSFDMFHGLLRDPGAHFRGKELVFVDSGGYELSEDFDGTEPRQYAGKPALEFNQDQYDAVLRALPRDLPFVIANFDFASRGLEVESQIRSARALLAQYPSFLSDFIVKPSARRAAYLDVEEIVFHLNDMRSFQILGITEREAGKTLLDRLVTIARLRQALDERGMTTPIHVWGGLDPLITPMYFCAGAEVFDGISWMRYGYHDDVALPRDAYTALVFGIQAQKTRSIHLRLANNLDYLEKAEMRMKEFVQDGCASFSVFGAHCTAIEAGYRALLSRVAR